MLSRVTKAATQLVQSHETDRQINCPGCRPHTLHHSLLPAAGLFQSSAGQRSSPASAGNGPLSRVPVGGASGEIKRILDSTCHYDVLGVPPEADRPAITAARKAKSLMVHPDRQGGGSTAGSHEAQQRVNQVGLPCEACTKHQFWKDLAGHLLGSRCAQGCACLLKAGAQPSQTAGQQWPSRACAHGASNSYLLDWPPCLLYNCSVS